MKTAARAVVEAGAGKLPSSRVRRLARRRFALASADAIARPFDSSHLRRTANLRVKFGRTAAESGHFPYHLLRQAQAVYVPSIIR